MTVRRRLDAELVRRGLLGSRRQAVERLKALTLMTYADITAVNPTVMTPWRAQGLWRLYLSVYNELTRELETERIEIDPSGSPANRKR